MKRAFFEKERKKERKEAEKKKKYMGKLPASHKGIGCATSNEYDVEAAGFT